MISPEIRLTRALAGASIGVAGVLVAWGLTSPGFLVGIHFNPQSLVGALDALLGALLSLGAGTLLARVSSPSPRSALALAVVPLTALGAYVFASDPYAFTGKLLLLVLVPACILGAEVERRRRRLNSSANR